MADHVAIGVIDHHQPEPVGRDGLDQPVGDFAGRHFRLQVVGRDLRRRHHDAFLAGEKLFPAAVEKKRHMGVFLGLGDAQLRHTGIRHNLAENPGGNDRWKQAGEEAVEVAGIFDHAAGRRPGDRGSPRKIVEFGIDQGGENLAHAVGAEITRQQAVARRHAGIIADHRRQHEFIRLAASIGDVDRRQGVLGRRAARRHQGVIGQGNAIPAIVAVHGVIAPGDGGDTNAGNRLRGGDEIGDIALGARRRHVPAISEDMHHDGDAMAGDDPRERRDLPQVTVYAAVRDDPQDMADTLALPELGGEFRKDGIAGQGAVGDRLIDARHDLGDHPAGADIHMADLGIAHLVVGQADIGARGGEQAMGTARHETVPDRGMGLGDGVVLHRLAIAPAVEDAQHDGTRCCCHTAQPPSAVLCPSSGRATAHIFSRL